MPPEVVYVDVRGHRYKIVGRLPWCELTPGCAYAVDNDATVYIRSGAKGKTPTLDQLCPGLADALRNEMVFLLERLPEEG